MVLFSHLSWGTEAFIPDALTLSEGGNELTFETIIFQTTGVVTEEGIGFQLAEDNYYQRYDFNFKWAYGFTDDFEGYTGFGARYIQAQDNSTGETANYNQGALTSALLGFKYGFKERNGFKLTLEGYYQKALFENEEYQILAQAPDDISMGDDTREIAVGLNMFSRSDSNNYLTGSFFYRDPSQKLSSEILSNVAYNLAWKYFSFGVGLENNFSLETDSYSNDPENKPQTNNGPSEYFNSVNRSWTAPYAQMNLYFGGNWRLESRYAQVTTGNSTDKGPRITLALVKRDGVDKAKRSFKRTDRAFKQYKVEGLVTKVASSKKACIIDKGLVEGVERGQQVDFYHFDYVDGNRLIGSGIVARAEASRSLVKIVRKYSKKRVEEGTVARVQQIRE